MYHIVICGHMFCKNLSMFSWHINMCCYPYFQNIIFMVHDWWIFKFSFNTCSSHKFTAFQMAGFFMIVFAFLCFASCSLFLAIFSYGIIFQIKFNFILSLLWCTYKWKIHSQMHSKIERHSYFSLQH